jgi:hypothetical protein
MEEEMVKRMREWLNLLVEKVDTKKILTIVMPGNDDEFVIDPVIKEFEDRGIVYPLDKIIEIEGHEVMSFEYVKSNPPGIHLGKETIEKFKRCSKQKLQN